VHALDVADDASIERAAAELQREPIDILINNAGIAGRWGSLAEPDYKGWEDTFRVNTIGPFRVTYAFRPHLLKSKVRKVITISSGMGSTAESEGGSYAYRSSKAAVNNVMRTLAADWRGDGFIIVLLHPGWVKTDMGGPTARLAPGESIAAMRKIIARLELYDTGRFISYRGTDIPW
jgi:NAD(P)-dependent dehydrogenase (short-subunit alcohol dehydrogenase family)